MASPIGFWATQQVSLSMRSSQWKTFNGAVFSRTASHQWESLASPPICSTDSATASRSAFPIKFIRLIKHRHELSANNFFLWNIILSFLNAQCLLIEPASLLEMPWNYDFAAYLLRTRTLAIVLSSLKRWTFWGDEQFWRDGTVWIRRFSVLPDEPDSRDRWSAALLACWLELSLKFKRWTPDSGQSPDSRG